jgi:hypothetical protein
MYHLVLKGTVTSKRSVDVPVFRHWRLVLERRELGTKVDKVEIDIPITFTADEDSKTIKLTNDLSLVVKLTVKTIEISPLYKGQLIPGVRTFAIPTQVPKPLAWHNSPWRGVKIDVEGYFRWVD